MAIAGKLLVELVPQKLASDPSEARRLLARFRGLLLVHGAMENDALYPQLLTHEDATVRAKAQALLDEVGAVYEGVHDHGRRWATTEDIQRDPGTFARETVDLLKRLGRRMVRENNELYPLADATATA